MLGVGDMAVAQLGKRQNTNADVIDAILPDTVPHRAVNNSVDNFRRAVQIGEVKGHERVRKLTKVANRLGAHLKGACLQAAHDLIGAAAKLTVHKQLDFIRAVGSLRYAIHKLQGGNAVGRFVHRGGVEGAVHPDHNGFSAAVIAFFSGRFRRSAAASSHGNHEKCCQE